MKRAYTRCALLALALTLACNEAEPVPEPPPVLRPQPTRVAFDSATITFVADGREVQMEAEVAERDDQRAFGLMDRDSLAADAGMIFLYDTEQPAGSAFWMYRTRIPLDIAFFDGAGRIVAIMQMAPCTTLDASRCPPYSPNVPYFGAVEANRGWFAANDIEVGDRVVLPGRLGG